ncbi:MAG: pilus assembly protein PilP [Desulfobacterales bacterium]|nr:MAG: pilus assembly protein PilP [Desulfobacterales bacterium]
MAKAIPPAASPQAPIAASPIIIAKKHDALTPPGAKPATTRVKKPAIQPKSAISKVETKANSDGAEISGPPMASTAPGATADHLASLRPFYNPEGRIDPFEPLFKEKQEVAKKKRKRRTPRTPLERVDLSQLKLVGIITADSGNRAMVEEASGKGYIISKGTFIGINSGKVVEIQKDKVIVEEEEEDLHGKFNFRTRELKLPKPPGE